MDDSDFCLFESEIEELYRKKENSTGWKEYPKMKPQQEGLYRVEYKILLGDYKECWRYQNGEWCTQFGKQIPIDSIPIFDIRFKAWDEE